MALFVIEGKGVVKEVKTLKSGERVVVLPHGWDDTDFVRLYKLKKVSINED